MSPQFFFRIDEIGETEDSISHYNNSGQWYPSPENGAHIRTEGGVTHRWYFCDGQIIYEVRQLPVGAEHFKTMSMYFGGGSGLWVLDGDALVPPDDAVWHTLHFEHSAEDYSSYVTFAAEHSTLRLQGKGWPTLLLPDIYHTTSTHPEYGGLKGELPILLGLVALSTSKDYLYSVLPTTFTQGEWQVHKYGCPRMNQRGIVVYVYTCPVGYYEGAKGSTKQELIDYEEGVYGKYYH
ncbi:hypothetical protein P154DRAFT_300093 [Amniculicola lignicola CBS 123094]|uniref:Uncharacterized protein n=1 Tax=Amniculicola lignicola CBS 123094 TaxID=1392246 RepID=A0A6A5W7X7_9PLEO|nr:hypothetical protein P154DRAFT_300093 [Amniculicola lignicola CBS 123094]